MIPPPWLNLPFTTGTGANANLQNRKASAQEAEARNKANRIASPKPAEPALAAATMVAPPRSLPDGPLLAPRLRPDAEERRHSYRRAEDLLLD